MSRLIRDDRGFKINFWAWSTEMLPIARQVTVKHFFHVVMKSSPCHPSLCNPTDTQWWAVAQKHINHCYNAGRANLKCVGRSAVESGSHRQAEEGSVRRERQADITSAPESQNTLLKSHPASAAREGVDNSVKGISSWARSAFNSRYFVKPKRN